MKNKQFTFLLSLTFLFLFSGSVYGQEEVKKEYWGNGKLKSKTPHNGLGSVWYESGKKKIERLYKNGEKDGLEIGRRICLRMARLADAMRHRLQRFAFLLVPGITLHVRG